MRFKVNKLQHSPLGLYMYIYTAADCNRRDVVKPKAQGL